ncbi:MAG: peptidylprolyl isomerase [Firmicutes bacterium]|nr:peptidylprolyl isomerase [Bacillota bacterium]
MATKNVNCTINLTDGRAINLELYSDIAPISVDNFVKVAKSGFYEGLCFHRVIAGFMIQGGGMIAGKGSLDEKRGLKPIKGEFDSNGVKNPLKHTLGVISMARTNVPDSATSQFFLCAADCDFLDGNYAGFGKTTDAESDKVIVDISLVKTTNVGYHGDVPVEPIVIKNVIVK